MIGDNFKKWDKSERRDFKDHFNGLIKGVYNIGNILVATPENLRLELSKLPLMQKPGNY